MLFRRDASPANDGAIVALLKERNLFADVDAPRFTTEERAAARLRRVLEGEERVGEFRSVTMDGTAGYFYICRVAGAPFHSRPFAVGVGETQELAICDAFLHWSTRA